MSVFNVDIASLYRERMAQVGRPKTNSDWDARADEMNQKAGPGAYLDGFLKHLDLSDCSTLLDVGCGTGLIALAAASRLQAVLGLDYSTRMLQLLTDNAAKLGLSNVHPVHRSWEDSWDDVPACDVVVASRSTAVSDMADALTKLTQKAKRRVYLTSLVGGRFIDAHVFAVIGRPLPPPQPDYIFILSMLYDMGIHPKLDHICCDGRLNGTQDSGEFVRKVEACVGALSEEEVMRLESWYNNVPEQTREDSVRLKWSLISWDVSS